MKFHSPLMLYDLIAWEGFYYVIYCSYIHLYLPTLGFSKGLFKSSYSFMNTPKQAVLWLTVFLYTKHVKPPLFHTDTYCL